MAATSTLPERVTRSAEETETVGEELAPLLPAGGRLLLVGEPRAGQPTVARGVAPGPGAAGPGAARTRAREP